MAEHWPPEHQVDESTLHLIFLAEFIARARLRGDVEGGACASGTLQELALHALLERAGAHRAEALHLALDALGELSIRRHAGVACKWHRCRQL